MPKKEPDLKYQREPDARAVRSITAKSGGLPTSHAEMLGGYSAPDYPRKAENARITGKWTFDNIRGVALNFAFSTNVLSVVSGTLDVTKAAGVLAQTMVVPEQSNVWTMLIADPPDGGLLFEDNDICRAQAVVDDATQETWFTVDNRYDLANGTQMYKCTWAYGDDEVTYDIGGLIADYGASGQGFHRITADAANAPYYNISTHAGSPWTTTTTRVHLGNMNGQYGIASDYYGAGLGDYAAGNYLRYETNGGFKISAGGEGMEITDAGLSFNAPDGAESAQASITFYDGSSNEIGNLTSYYSSVGNSHAVRVHSKSISGDDSIMNVYATCPTTKEAQVILRATSGSDFSALVLYADDSASPTNYAAFTASYVSVSGDARIGGGLYVGATGTDPDDDDVWCDGEVSTDGGTTRWDLGGYTAGAPTPDGYISVDINGTTYKIAAELP